MSSFGDAERLVRDERCRCTALLLSMPACSHAHIVQQCGAEDVSGGGKWSTECVAVVSVSVPGSESVDATYSVPMDCSLGRFVYEVDRQSGVYENEDLVSASSCVLTEGGSLFHHGCFAVTNVPTAAASAVLKRPVQPARPTGTVVLDSAEEVRVICEAFNEAKPVLWCDYSEVFGAATRKGTYASPLSTVPCTERSTLIDWGNRERVLTPVVVRESGLEPPELSRRCARRCHVLRCALCRVNAANSVCLNSCGQQSLLATCQSCCAYVPSAGCKLRWRILYA